MSHEATNWAIKQRGLKPTTKIVLWHLCDRFNPDYGCFPSQDRLAHDCEISRSTLNDHLGQLEAVGLLRRVPRLDPVTKRQLPTRYILGFEPGFTPVAVVPCPEIGHGEGDGAEIAEMVEGSRLDGAADALPCPDFGHGDEASPVSDFPAEPCPENAESRVRNPDTNPVREPLSKPVKEEEGAQARAAVSDQVFGELLDALGLDPAVLPGWWQGWPPRLHVQRWRDELGLTEAEIIAAAEASRKEHPEPPDGPKALDRAMQRTAQRKVEDAGRKRRKPKTPPTQAAKPITDLPAFYADLVNSDRYLPVSAISNTMRDAMLARGLVTAERLAKAADTPVAELRFDVTNHPTRVAIVEALKGRRGWLTLRKLAVTTFETEEYLLFSGIDDNGRSIDHEACAKLFSVGAGVHPIDMPAHSIADRLQAEAEQHVKATLNRSLDANNKHFAAARDRLERWAEDKIYAAEKALKDTKEQIKAVRREARAATTLEEEAAIQAKLQELERRQRKQRQEIFNQEDEVADKRDELIANLQKRLSRGHSVESLFTVRWAVV